MYFVLLLYHVLRLYHLVAAKRKAKQDMMEMYRVRFLAVDRRTRNGIEVGARGSDPLGKLFLCISMCSLNELHPPEPKIKETKKFVGMILSLIIGVRIPFSSEKVQRINCQLSMQSAHTVTAMVVFKQSEFTLWKGRLFSVHLLGSIQFSGYKIIKAFSYTILSKTSSPSSAPFSIFIQKVISNFPKCALKTPLSARPIW